MGVDVSVGHGRSNGYGEVTQMCWERYVEEEAEFPRRDTKVSLIRPERQPHRLEDASPPVPDPEPEGAEPVPVSTAGA